MAVFSQCPCVAEDQLLNLSSAILLDLQEVFQDTSVHLLDGSTILSHHCFDSYDLRVKGLEFSVVASLFVKGGSLCLFRVSKGGLEHVGVDILLTVIYRIHDACQLGNLLA